MSPDGFLEGHVKVVVTGGAAVVSGQFGEHRPIPTRVKNSFENHVVARIEGVADGVTHEPDIGCLRPVVLAEQYPSNVVLLNPGDAAPDSVTQQSGDGALSGSGVPTQDH